MRQNETLTSQVLRKRTKRLNEMPRVFPFLRRKFNTFPRVTYLLVPPKKQKLVSNPCFHLLTIACSIQIGH